MHSTKRAFQLFAAVCAWAFMSAAVSVLIVELVHLAELPASFSTLADGIDEIQDPDRLRKIAVLLMDAVSAQKDAGQLLISWALWFVATWSVILGGASLCLYRHLSASRSASDSTPDETILELALSGKLRLWKAFWGVYVALPVVTALVAFGVIEVLKRAGIVEPLKVADLILNPMAYSAVLVMYWGGAIVAWRCAVNTSRVAWRYLARIAIALFTVVPLARFAAIVGYYLGR